MIDRRRDRSWTAIVLVLPLLLSACGGPPATPERPAPPRVSAPTGVASAAGSTADTPTLWMSPADGALRLAFNETAGGTVSQPILRSDDGGRSWQRVSRVPPRYQLVRADASGLHAVSGQPDGVFTVVSRDQGATWSSPALLLDRNAIVAGSVVVAEQDGRLLAAWIDRRDGFDAVYAARSEDGGHTWGAPRLVERCVGGKTMHGLRSAMAGGRAYLVWQDDRDPVTLFDIRMSESDDGGASWTASRKVNDDTGAVWQSDAAIVTGESSILVFFSDFREAGDFDDNDFNIYAARSGGGAFVNARVNDLARGSQNYPVATGRGRQVAALWVDRRDSLFGDIFLATSPDFGETWSAAIRVNSGGPPARRLRPTAAYDRDGRLVVAYTEIVGGVPRVLVTRELARDSTEPAADAASAGTPQEPVALPQPSATPVFTDEFDKDAGAWEPVTGTWVQREGALVGFGAVDALAVRRGPDAADGILEGRFRLDPQEHRAASLLFRVRSRSSSRPLGYRIENVFREGALLWWRDETGEYAVASGRFSFRQYNWYRFRLAFRGDTVEYRIDDRVLLSGRFATRHEPGRLGLGALFHPAYFDDVIFRTFEPTASDRPSRSEARR